MNYFKTKDGRLNMLPIFAIVILLFGGIIFALWLPERNLHNQLQHEGKDIIAEIEQATYYEDRYRRAPDPITYNPNDADQIKLKLYYVVSGQPYTITLHAPFSLQQNDHATLKDAIQRGQVAIRYLPSDPTQARFTVEFTDPSNNPYFGGR